MNKADLKQRWGQYCDTDKLVDDIMYLLTKYQHRNSEHGVCKMLDVYFTNKSPLIELLKKSNHYVGDMRVVVDLELEREIDKNEVHRFCVSFPQNVNSNVVILKIEDANGKRLVDYLTTGTKSLKAKDLTNADFVNNLCKNNANKDQFDNEGYLKESVEAAKKFNWAISNRFANIYSATLSAGNCDALQNNVDYKLAPGMKTSRAFNRVCAYYGVDKLHKYNKLFAQYADLVTEGKRKLKFFISVNPLDYLTMSFGHSWSSCHTIDKLNKRNMPNNYSGQYCGGTMSYMLDGSSIITYVHTGMPETFEDGKLYRNMFHFADNMLIQGRVYPQSNDGATDLYQTFRQVVQSELSQMLGLESNLWVKKKTPASNNAHSIGVHYRDYKYFNGCNASYPKEKPECSDNIVEIGHNRVCTYCGEEFASINSGCLTHNDCYF